MNYTSGWQTVVHTSIELDNILGCADNKDMATQIDSD